MWIVFLAGNRLSSVKYKIYRLFKNIFFWPTPCRPKIVVHKITLFIIEFFVYFINKT